MSSSFRDRFETLSRGEIAGLVAFVALVLAGLVLWYLRSLPQPVAIEGTVGAISAPAPSAPVSPAAQGGSFFATPATAPEASAAASGTPSIGVVVHVAGWVQHPGVFELAPGSRAIDALDRAGGPRKGAQLDELNLAAMLEDGQQLLIPGPRPGKGSREASSSAADPTASTVDINSADATALQVLPGVGEVIAQRIVDYREQNGPFTKPEELLNVSGIGDVTFAEMQDQVTV